MIPERFEDAERVITALSNRHRTMANSLGVDIRDGEQAAWVTAILREPLFDPSRGVPFQAFLRQPLRWSMVREIVRGAAPVTARSNSRLGALAKAGKVEYVEDTRVAPGRWNEAWELGHDADKARKAILSVGGDFGPLVIDLLEGRCSVLEVADDAGVHPRVVRRVRDGVLHAVRRTGL